ncbi:MAG: hypothetical protein HY819_12935 [Acidobacteria bacterium]|nr:hypothetical protein [Acidobacteriota bacterium]
MEQEKPIIKINLADLKALAEVIIRQSSVILVQRDPNDVKMDERSALIHKLWLRVSERAQHRAGAYPNIKEHLTHEQVLNLKLKELLDKILETPLSSEDYAIFLDNLIERALKTSEKG